MKILHVIITFHQNSSAGGPVYNTYAYSQKSLERHHQVSVCCSNRLSISKTIPIDNWHRGISASTWDGIKINYIKSFHPGYGGYGAIISPSLIFYLHKVIKEYDVIHIHGAWNTFAITAGLLSVLYGVPYIIQLHNTFLIRSNRIMLKGVFHKLLRTPLLEHASAILAFAEDERTEYLQSRPQDAQKAHIVPGIIPNITTPEKGLFRHKFGIRSDEYLILFLGRLHKDKGINHLIQSISKLELNQLRLVIIGPDAGYADILQDMVKDLSLQKHVIFTGPIYGEEKFTAFTDADIFALPSLFEQLPVSALEAALCKTALILSDRCGMTETINETNAGVIVPYGDPNYLAEVIQSLRDNYNDRKEMGKNAKKMVENCYNNEQTIDALEKIYIEVSS